MTFVNKSLFLQGLCLLGLGTQTSLGAPEAGPPYQKLVCYPLTFQEPADPTSFDPIIKDFCGNLTTQPPRYRSHCLSPPPIDTVGTTLGVWNGTSKSFCNTTSVYDFFEDEFPPHKEIMAELVISVLDGPPVRISVALCNYQFNQLLTSCPPRMWYGEQKREGGYLNQWVDQLAFHPVISRPNQIPLPESLVQFQINLHYPRPHHPDKSRVN